MVKDGGCSSQPSNLHSSQKAEKKKGEKNGTLSSSGTSLQLVPGPEWNLVTGPLKGKEG